MLGGSAAVGMPGLLVARSSDLNKVCPGPDGGARDGDGDEVVDGGDVVAEGVEIGGGGTRGLGGISAAGTAMVTYRRGRESPKFKVENPACRDTPKMKESRGV